MANFNNDKDITIIGSIVISSIAALTLAFIKVPGFNEKITQLIPDKSVVSDETTTPNDENGENQIPTETVATVPITEATVPVEETQTIPVTEATTVPITTLATLPTTSVTGASDPITAATAPVEKCESPFIFDSYSIFDDKTEFPGEEYVYNNGTYAEKPDTFIMKMKNGEYTAYRSYATNQKYTTLSFKHAFRSTSRSENLKGENYFKVIGTLNDGRQKEIYSSKIDAIQPPTVKSFCIDNYDFITFEINGHFNSVFDIVVEPFFTSC